MVAMNIEQFASMSQDELVDWVAGMSKTYADDRATIKDVSDEELIFVVAAINGMRQAGYQIRGEQIDNFQTAVDEELFYRGTNTPVE
jgi:LPS sulfotransferase NodH